MKIVQRGNKQLRVADDRLEDMLAEGYIEINPKTGSPIAEDSQKPKKAMSK